MQKSESVQKDGMYNIIWNFNTQTNYSFLTGCYNSLIVNKKMETNEIVCLFIVVYNGVDVKVS